MHRLPSYTPEDAGLRTERHCPNGSESEPCYGGVETYDHFYDEESCEEDPITHCEAHRGCFSFVTPWKYVPSPHPQDAGAAPVDDEV